MNLATLRVEGTESALDAFQKVFPLEQDARWSTGDRLRNGSVHSSSGFTATIADAGTPAELTSLIRAFLMHCKEKGIVFPRLRLVAELAIGVTVGDSEQFVVTVEFAPSEPYCV
jgi:hypothetical protein